MKTIERALIDAYKHDIETYEEILRNNGHYQFSSRFENKMNKLLKVSSRKYVNVSNYGLRRSILIAIIVSLFMISATTAIAVTNPVIHYRIKDKLKCKEITFETTGSAYDDLHFVTLPAPADFDLESKKITAINAITVFKAKDGRQITIEQLDPNGSTVAFDSEMSDTKEITISNTPAIIKSNIDGTNIVWNNGKYLFHITFSCVGEAEAIDYVKLIAHTLK